MQSPVLVVQTLLHATELGLNKTCRTLFRQTCRDFDPQAVVARPAACRRGTAVRSACGAQGRRDGPALSTDARHAPEVTEDCCWPCLLYTSPSPRDRTR